MKMDETCITHASEEKWYEILTEGDHFERPDVDEWIIF
jgi:hypothetical protein